MRTSESKRIASGYNRGLFRLTTIDVTGKPTTKQFPVWGKAYWKWLDAKDDKDTIFGVIVELNEDTGRFLREVERFVR